MSALIVGDPTVNQKLPPLEWGEVDSTNKWQSVTRIARCSLCNFSRDLLDASFNYKLLALERGEARMTPTSDTMFTMLLDLFDSIMQVYP